MPTWIYWPHESKGRQGWAIGYEAEGITHIEEWYNKLYHTKFDVIERCRILNGGEGEMNTCDYRRESIINLLESIGEDSGREGLIDTPARVAKMYDEIFDGYKMNPKEILSRTFKDEKHKEMVIVRNIDFFSHCEHHMVPFFGKAHVGYVPEGTLVGLSKIVRLVECFAHRLQIQERMTSQIADSLVECLKPMGAIVVIEAEHLCMKMRGVRNPCADTVTSAVRGVFETVPAARSEFLTLMRGGG